MAVFFYFKVEIQLLLDKEVNFKLHQCQTLTTLTLEIMGRVVLPLPTQEQKWQDFVTNVGILLQCQIFDSVVNVVLKDYIAKLKIIAVITHKYLI